MLHPAARIVFAICLALAPTSVAAELVVLEDEDGTVAIMKHDGTTELIDGEGDRIVLDPESAAVLQDADGTTLLLDDDDDILIETEAPNGPPLEKDGEVVATTER